MIASSAPTGRKKRQMASADSIKRFREPIDDEQCGDYDALASEIFSLAKAMESKTQRPVHASEMMIFLTNPEEFNRWFEVEEFRVPGQTNSSFRIVFKNKFFEIKGKAPIRANLQVLTPYFNMPTNATLTPFGNLAARFTRVPDNAGPCGAIQLESLSKTGAVVSVGDNLRRYCISCANDAAFAERVARGQAEPKIKTEQSEFVNPTSIEQMHALGHSVKINTYRPLQKGESDQENEMTRYMALLRFFHKKMAEASLLSTTKRPHTIAVLKEVSPEKINDQQAEALLVAMREAAAKGTKHPLFDAAVKELYKSDSPIGDLQSKLCKTASGATYFSEEKEPFSMYAYADASVVNEPEQTASGMFVGTDVKEGRQKLNESYFEKSLLINGALISIDEAMHSVVWPVRPDKPNRPIGGVLRPLEWRRISTSAKGETVVVPLDNKSASYFLDNSRHPVISVAHTLRYQTTGGKSKDAQGNPRMITGGVQLRLSSVFVYEHPSERPWPSFSSAPVVEVYSLQSERARKAQESLAKRAKVSAENAQAIDDLVTKGMTEEDARGMIEAASTIPAAFDFGGY